MYENIVISLFERTGFHAMISSSGSILATGLVLIATICYIGKKPTRIVLPIVTLIALFCVIFEGMEWSNWRTMGIGLIVLFFIPIVTEFFTRFIYSKRVNKENLKKTAIEMIFLLLTLIVGSLILFNSDKVMSIESADIVSGYNQYYDAFMPWAFVSTFALIGINIYWLIKKPVKQ